MENDVLKGTDQVSLRGVQVASYLKTDHQFQKMSLQPHE